MTATITTEMPIEGPAYDKARPETRQPWLDFRRPGITATMIRDWGNGSRRRKILEEKVTGDFEDLSHLPYVAHGNVREPVIADWVYGKFGIKPCDSVYAHPQNSRHLASPDGISTDPFSGELLVGPDAVLAEIKTSKHDLYPGALDMNRALIAVEEGSHFDRSNYYTQMQWQMYVMNAEQTLFVWEQHDNVIDPETNTFTPIGPPQWAIIPRNQALIDVLVEKVAPKALAEIDAALTALRTNDLPPASDFPTEHALWVQDVLDARDTIATAEAVRTKSWDSLAVIYLDPEAPDRKEDLGFATLSVSTSTSAAKTVDETITDWDAVRAGLTDAQRKKYDSLVEKHTTTQPKVIPGKTSRRMTITPKETKP